MELTESFQPEYSAYRRWPELLPLQHALFAYDTQAASDRELMDEISCSFKAIEGPTSHFRVDFGTNKHTISHITSNLKHSPFIIAQNCSFTVKAQTKANQRWNEAFERSNGAFDAWFTPFDAWSEPFQRSNEAKYAHFDLFQRSTRPFQAFFMMNGASFTLDEASDGTFEASNGTFHASFAPNDDENDASEAENGSPETRTKASGRCPIMAEASKSKNDDRKAIEKQLATADD